MKDFVHVIGAGLSGAEAAFAAARAGVKVKLHEMRPKKMTPAHHTEMFAEIVCSNSLGGEGEGNAKGLLQAEMRKLDSIVMRAADESRVPAGGALAVDREIFSSKVTKIVESNPAIEVIREEVSEIPQDEVVVLATGPLTSDALAKSIGELTGNQFLSFYDAAAPIVLGESIDMNIAYRAGRYGQSADYINCPMSEEEYKRFYDVLSQARAHVPHEWEKLEFFEGCMPIEEIGRRGFQTPLFGPMKPVGLEHPQTGKRAFAVVQLRSEDREGRMWSLVGFQTGLKWPDQKTVLQTIPGLQNAEIVRYGVMHRNTYLNAPKLIHPSLQFREHPRVFVAGVLCGVEGYLESAATGWLAGMNAARYLRENEGLVPPADSMLGGLVRFLATAESKNFQPMNANWGLVPSLDQRLPKKEIRIALAQRATISFDAWRSQTIS